MYCLRQRECGNNDKMKPIPGGFECVGCKNRVDYDGLRLGVSREEILARVLRFDLTVAEMAAVQRLYNEHARMKVALERINNACQCETEDRDVCFGITVKALRGIV